MRQMNPIFIPKSFEKTNKDGERTLYCNRLVLGRNLRIIEHYDEDGLIKSVNVWGICGKLEESVDCFVVLDEKIDSETMKELRKPIEAMYPAHIKPMFFS